MQIINNTKFCLQRTLLNFWTKLIQKGCFQSKKNENQNWILHNRINLGSKLLCMFLPCHVRVSELIHTLVACNWTRNHSHLVHKQKLNHLWLFICTVHLAVCSYVKHAFQSESSLYNCLNHLVSLAKWLSVR